MSEFSMGSGALAALSTLGATATPTRTWAPMEWTWSPNDSIAGTGGSADPRWVWDPEADPIVADLLDRGAAHDVDKLLWDWVRNDQPLPAGLPADLIAFAERARQLPPWADRGMLATAAEFYAARGFYLDLLVGLGGGLLNAAILEQPSADVCSPSTYQAHGNGVVDAVKTRLAHAARRHRLAQSPNWRGDVPISQADLLVSWHTRPTYALRKLREWRVPITAAESEAYLHLWQVTAYLVGIHDEYIPATWAAAQSQSDQVLPPSLGPSRRGVQLTNELLGQVSTVYGGRPLWNALARHLVGDEIADWHEIPREPIWGPTIKAVWPMLCQLGEGVIARPLIPEVACVLDEAVRQYNLLYLTKSADARMDLSG